MSILELSPEAAREGFDVLVAAFVRQHVRTKFRRDFGLGKLGLDARTFLRGTITGDLEKPISNLLQEQPETIRATLFHRTPNGLAASSRTEPSSVTMKDLMGATEVERALHVRGRRAQLFIYADPTEPAPFVLRVSLESESPTPPPLPARASRMRRKRKAAAEAK